ncbi:S-layer homology domain-containing protein [Paenibacillus planticolens]|nr:S-layer homology domain-containing protein [Paenibacillus planticolens]
MLKRKTIFTTLFCNLCLSLAVVAPVSAADDSQFVMSASGTESDNGEFTVTLKGENIQDLFAYEVKFNIDGGNIEVVKASTAINGFSVPPIVKNNEVTFAHTKIGKVDGEKGNVEIGTITFKAKKAGTTNIKWTDIKIVDHNLGSQTFKPNESTSFMKVFGDLSGHWAKSDIMQMVDKKVVEGMDDDHFAPNTNVTRAQFATLLSKALNLQDDSGQNPFADVSSGSWYESTVKKSYAAGLINGVADNAFAPEQNITREEMTAMLLRAKAYATGTKIEDMNANGSLSFSDEGSISSWAKKAVVLAVDSGLMNGRTDQEFAPHDNASRAESVVVLKRLIAGLN